MDACADYDFHLFLCIIVNFSNKILSKKISILIKINERRKKMRRKKEALKNKAPTKQQCCN